MRKSTSIVSKKTSLQQRDKQHQDDALATVPVTRHTCTSVVELAYSLAKNKTKMIESVTLTPSQYPSCAGISVTLVDDLSHNMVSPLIVLEGETKVYKSKTKADMFGKRDLDAYFMRVKVTAASPMLGQLLDNIYNNIKTGSRIPVNMNIPNLDAYEERTFRNGMIYINKMSSAMVEYTSDESTKIVSITRELESLSNREPQVAMLVLAPMVVYRGSSEIKVTFALKRLSMEGVARTTVVDVLGNHRRLVMSETGDDDENLRLLGTIQDTPEIIDDAGYEDALFNV